MAIKVLISSASYYNDETLIDLPFSTNDMISIKSSLIKGLSMSIAASRFANCMYLALSSGLDTDRSLEMAEKLIDNPYMLAKINDCKKHIRNGEPFIKSLLLSGIFSKVYSSMMTIGFKTGSMDDIMQKISEAYEEETDEKLRHFISILEPTLIVILSFFIGLILISFLLPLLGIMSSIG